MAGGRPSTYTKAMAAEICAELAAGTPLTTICEAKGKPSVQTVYRWLQTFEQFREEYARAREDQADTLADEIVRIADAAMGKSSEEVQAARLAVDSRKWIAAKMKPKKYGDRIEHAGKVEHEHTAPSLAVVAAALGISTQSAIAPPKDAGHTPAPNKSK